MSDIRERFGRAAAHFGELVHQVKDDQWGDATPCTEWDVRALVNHLVYEARWVVPILDGQTIAQVGDRFEGDLLGDDAVASYDAALQEATAAVRDVDLGRTVHLSFGDLPAADYLTQLTSDFVVHGWDLARGIGADDRMDPDMVRFVHAAAEPQADMLAASGLFATPVPVADDADDQTKLLALFGRRP
ncbi:MAG TPA: TIGR03086 family metal-binding protein [Mycobacteriales bacterium]|nr:TIGR03086 family metal-binding protein [Mycobacteriales bacterium]